MTLSLLSHEIVPLNLSEETNLSLLNDHFLTSREAIALQGDGMPVHLQTRKAILYCCLAIVRLDYQELQGTSAKSDL